MRSLLLLACVACADPEATFGTPASPPGPCEAGIAIEPGVGELSFTPLADGDPLVLTYGPAGGWYPYVAARVSGTGPEVAVVPEIRVPSLDDLRIAGDQEPTYLALEGYDSDACAGDALSVRTFVDDETPTLDFVCSLDGVELELTVTVTDLADGASASSTVTVVAALDPIDVERCAEL